MRRRMLVACLACLILPFTAQAARAVEAYEVDPVHSDVAFKVRHLVSYVTGHFRDFVGAIHLDRGDLANSSVEFTIQVSSIDTANERRDNHLRSEEFFHVDEHPEMTFKSTRVEKASGDTYNVTGRFTLHGVQKSMTIPVEVLGFTKHPRFGERAGFGARFSLSRSDYGIDWNLPMEAGSLVLGEEVKIEINIEAFKSQEEKEEEKGEPE